METLRENLEKKEEIKLEELESKEVKSESKHRKRKLAIRMSVIFLLVLLAEVFIFNLKSFGPKGAYEVDFSRISTETPGTVSIAEEGVWINGEGSVTYILDNPYVHGLEAMISADTDCFFFMSVDMKDENWSQEYIKVAQKYVSTKNQGFDASFLNYGEVKEIRLNFSNVTSPFYLQDVSFVESLSFHFSWLRFLVLLVFLELICVVVTLKVYQWEYRRDSKVQSFVLAVMFLLSVVLLLTFYNPEQKATKYSETDYTYSDAYTQLFDSMLKGRWDMVLEPPAELAELENVYDRSLRDGSGISYYWDRAYYEGKYYVYFGIAPILLFYYPFYFLSGGYMPTTNMACIFFGILAVYFMYQAVLTFLKKFTYRINFLVLCSILSSGLFVSGIAYLCNYSCFYVLPPVCSTCLLFLCLWAGMKGCQSKKTIKQCLWLFVCGISFILCFEARMPKAVSALILAPSFLYLLFRKRYSIKRKAACVFSFMVPVILGLVGVMWRNYIRFDSVFEFGSSYQLTLSDIHANKVTWKLFVPALFQFFLQPFSLRETFPFLDFSIYNMKNYGKYMCQEGTLGLFGYPILALGIGATVFLLWNMRKKEKVCSLSKYRVRSLTMFLGLLFLVLVAWLDFCVGGVVIRYVTDIMPLALLLSGFGISEMINQTRQMKNMQKNLVALVAVMAFLSIVLGYTQLYLYLDGETILTHPQWYNIFEDMVCFWN